MKNKSRIILPLILVVLTLILTGFTVRPIDVLTEFRNMKVESVDYGKIYINKPGIAFNVNKNLDENDLKLLIKLLNKSEDIKECRLPLSKGGFSGLILYMKSGRTITLANAENGFCLWYGNKRYEIIQPRFRRFFHYLIKKYAKL